MGNGKFKTLGVMLDVSRNAVMKVSALKKYIEILSDLGFNMLQLYMEDTMKTENQPYLGYMRGGYSPEEIREIDAYCLSKGIELVPAVQTLAHYTNTCKLAHYADTFDWGDILLIGSEKTYELIDDIFATISHNFTSKKVNIGMDEAAMVGLGKYLEKHGFVNRNELLVSHLKRVAEIAEKYGFELQMWSDMFFRLNNGGEYYSRTPVLDESAKNALPENVVPIFWDYYHVEEEDYDAMFEAHKKFGKETWFAGGLWSWTGFVPNNLFSMSSMRSAIKSAIRYGVDNVIFTEWGDDGKECSFFALLPALYAVSRYAAGEFDEKSIKAGFEKKFGIAFDDYMALDLPNESFDENKLVFPTKALFYADPFLGIADKELEAKGNAPYGEYAKRIADVGKKAGEFSYVFECVSDFASALELKADLGLRVRKAYAEDSKEELAKIAEHVGILIGRIEKLYGSFKTLWNKENKPFGFEIHEYRLGGLMLRLGSCKERIEKYLADGTPIEELGEDVLPLNGKLNDVVFRWIISPSEI